MPVSSVEGVCLLQSLPVTCHLVPYPGHKMQDWLVRLQTQAVVGFKIINKKTSTKDQCEFLACLNFSLRAQHFGINGERFRLMFLHPIVPYLLTKLGWQWNQHKEDPNKLLNPPSQGCPGAERAVQLLRTRARQKDHHSGSTDRCQVGSFHPEPLRSLHRDNWTATEGNDQHYRTGPDQDLHPGFKSFSSFLLTFRITQTLLYPGESSECHKNG